MPKCLLKYQWVKLPRACMPSGKGIMGYWAKLAAHAAFRKGRAQYCGYTNDVVPGMWSGGIVGLKSILGVKSRTKAIDILNTLQQHGYGHYTLNEKTKKLEYAITDWVIKCSGAECMNGAVYATDGYGFLCLPRSITQRLAEQHYTFGESDAWLDLWCHTVWRETGNAFSYLAPAVQLGRLGAALTLEALGRRWGWEKTKVWRFFQKHGDVFALYRLPGAYGCLIFNKLYPLDTEVSLPTHTEIERIIGEMRICADNTHIAGSDNTRLNKMILWYSRRIMAQAASDHTEQALENRIALPHPIIRAYFSLCWNCQNCIYDCRSMSIRTVHSDTNHIRGPCVPADFLCSYDKEKENRHEQKRKQQRQVALRTAGK